MKKILAALAISAALIAPVSAQVSNGKVTTSAPTYGTGNIAPFSLDTAGNLRVVNGGSPSGTQNVNLSQILGASPSLTNPLWVFPATGATFPVSGTFWQATQPVSGTFWQTTQPVSAASLPLPTGAATSANQVTAWQGATGSAVPANTSYSGANSSGNLVGIIQADNSVPITISTNTVTQLVALSSGKKIYVTSFDVISAGTANFTLVYGTGSNCGTGQNPLTGVYPLTAQSGIAKGGGLGPVLVVPAGNALCVVDSASVLLSGSLSYTQF